MKIKTKKQFTLPQLIEWAWENDVKDSEFQTVKDERGVFYEACFSEDGSFYSIDELDSNDTFTVEVEEEITEDTKLFLVERYIDEDGNSQYHKYKESSIKNAIENNPSYYETTHFYIENDDRELVLIWRDGKLVE